MGGEATLRDVEGELKALAGSAGLPRRARVRSAIASLPRTVDLLRALTEADLRFRYGRGSGRFLRWLLEPFALVGRSEEHTSELQSHHDLVCRLLLEKKNKVHVCNDRYRDSSGLYSVDRDAQH